MAIAGALLSANSLQASKREQLLEFLDRVENGAAPCHSLVCQASKEKLLIQLEQDLSIYPLISMDEQNHGLLAAQRILKTQHLMPEPTSLSDYHDFWRRRFQDHFQQEAHWLRLKTQLAAHRRFLRNFLREISPHLNRPQFKEIYHRYWSTELGELCYLIIKNAELTTKTSPASEKQISQNLDRIEHLRSQLPLELSELLERLFPEQSKRDQIELSALLFETLRYFGETDLSTPAFLTFLTDLEAESAAAFRHAQDFHDLEYGVVGLKHFEDTNTPVEVLDLEISVQTTLDHLESAVEIALDTLSFALLLYAADSSFVGNRLLTIFSTGLASYWVEREDLKLQDLFWPESQYSQHLKVRRASIAKEVQQRKQALEQTRARILHQLNDFQSEQRPQENP